MIKHILSSIKKISSSSENYTIDDFFLKVKEKNTQNEINVDSKSTLSEKHSQKNELAHFTFIENHSFIDIICKENLKLNNNEPIIFTITENENILNSLHIKVKNNVLIIKYTNHNILKFFNNISKKIKLEINIKSLKKFSNFSIGDAHIECNVTEKIVQKGTGNIHIKNSQASFIESTSIGNITIEEQKNKELYINSSSTGNINIKNGTVDKLKVYTNSIGNLNVGATIKELTTQNKGTGNQKFRNVLSYAEITLNSIGNINLSGEVNSHCKIYSKGTGNIYVSQLHSKLLDIYNTSIGNIQLDGYVEEATIISKGLGDIKAKKLEIYKVNVNNTGHGNIKYTQANKSKIKSVFTNKKTPSTLEKELAIDSDIFGNVDFEKNYMDIESDVDSTTYNDNEENDKKTRQEKKMLSRRRRFK